MPALSNKFIKVFFAFIFLLLPLLNDHFHLQAASRPPTNYHIPKFNHPTATPEYVPGEVIVKFKKDKLNIASNSLITYVKKFGFPLIKGLRSKSENRLGNTVVYKINNSLVPIENAINTLKKDPSVEYAQPNYYRHITSLGTNDTYATNLWGLDNTGQTLTLSDGITATGTADADIDMPEAWVISTGTTDIIVAVIDTGVAYTHPDLINNMWDGTHCVDENGSALGDCLHGYDFEDNDKNPLPTFSSHGTHVAGTIAATRNNSKGIAGVGPRIKIMAIKCDLSISCLISSINFAKQNGAKVINASYGGPGSSDPEKAAISDFQAAGGIFIAAAGNESTNNDTAGHFYPSDYDLSSIISVAAIDQGNSLADFSDFGATSVDVAAPGVNIYSTVDETPVINYNFNSLSNGQLPATWTSDLGASWGAGEFGDSNMVIWSDYYIPYAEGVNSVVTSDTLSLSTVANAKFEFTTGCDTEYTNPALGGDYMALEVSSDGASFTQLTRWNEFSLADGGVAMPGIYGYGNILDIGVSSQYLTSTFKYRLRWVTNSNGNTGTAGNGCFVDNFKILTYTDGSNELYDFYDGTSMAAPHVAGLAGYLWSISPSLTANNIISNIFTNGDSLASLSGKTVTGKKINAYNSVAALEISTPGPSITGLTNNITPARSKTWTWSSDNPSTDTYRYLIDQSASSVPSGTYGTGVTASVSSGTGTFYIHVQAKDVSNNQGAVTTVSCLLDNTGPAPTLESSTSNSFVLNFSETVYNLGGSAIANDQDMAGYFTAVPSTMSLIGSTFSDNKITLTTSNSLAGGRVTLNTGTSATNLYDSLGNGSTDITTVFNGTDWHVNPSILSLGTSFLPDLFISGVFVTAPGADSGQSSLVNVTENLLINVGSLINPNTVNIPDDTNISELSDAQFDASLVQLTDIDTATVSNLGSDYISEGAIQWGIVGTTLKFNNPLTINIFVGATLNNQTLNVFRSLNLNSGWTSDGIISPATCTVASGYCQFTATQASYYVAAYSPSAAITPTPTGTNTSSNPPIFTQKHNAPQCADTSPLLAPDLFKIVTGKESAKIFFTPINGKVTGYEVIYGFKKDDNRFGAMFNYINNNQGEQNFTINKLNSKTTYYFKVAAINGCTSGPWSDWIPAKANSIKTINKYKTALVNKKVVLVNLYK